MAKDLAQLVQKPVAAVINFGDGDVYKVRFKPHEKMKQEADELQQRIDEAKDETAVKAEAYATFCRIFTEWDMPDNGVLIPLTPEGLAAAMSGEGVPPSLLTAFIIRAYEDFFAPKMGTKRR
jgi:hypothetical protein